MTFYEVLEQVIGLLQRHGRVTYRALKREFDLDDAYIDDLKYEMIKARQLAIDQEGELLIWSPTSSAGELAEPHDEHRSVTPASSSSGASMAASLASVLASSARPESTFPETISPEAERRQLTVMFCDLVDSTALAVRLDPEDWREVVRAYQETCADVIQRLDGHVAQYLGDGLLIYFGYPQAHEDDAQRAVRAGLALLKAVERLNLRLQRDRRIRLALRVGIHTGLVVVGDIGSGEYHQPLALGETPNIAARIQGRAGPDTVVISAATAHLVQGYFACHDLGPQALKGVELPVSMFRVLGESEARSRFEVATPGGLSPLVGREPEVELLLERWQRVRDGQGQVVLLNGEAGIGKSRLVQVMKDHVASVPHMLWECRCSPYYQTSAFYPLIDMLQRLWRLRREDAAEVKVLKLERALEAYLTLSHAVPLFASLLSVPLGDAYAVPSRSPEQYKRQTLEAVLALLLAQSEMQPVLLVVEDLHLADASTLDFLGFVIEQTASAEVLTLLTFRPPFQPPWTLRSHVTAVALSRLARPQVERMIIGLARGKALPPEVEEELVTKTDGVPLFVEELTKMVLESEWLQERDTAFELVGPLPPLAIPATLQDSLMARLDRLGAGKAVVQLGAALGRVFSYDLLRAIAPLDERSLRWALDQLVAAELLHQQGVPPTSTYFFKHALLQESAYQALLKGTRQQYHARIAEVLVDQFHETVEMHPELLAHHYHAAGRPEEAVTYWQQAGERAIARSANTEAVSHLQRGLEALAELPETVGRHQSELQMQIQLGPVLMATQGQASPEVEAIYSRAHALCQEVEESAQLFPVMRGLWNYYLVRGELQTANELGDALLPLAERLGQSKPMIEARWVVGVNRMFGGDFSAALTHLQQGLVYQHPDRERSLGVLQEPDVGCLCNLAHVQWYLGFPDQARASSQAALTLAEELGHPYSMVWSQFFAAHLALLCRDTDTVEQYVEPFVGMATEHRFTLWAAVGPLFQGWALAQRGQREEGIARMRQGINSIQEMGAGVLLPYGLGLLAAVIGRMGQVAEALSILSDALAVIERTGERRDEAELHRLRGELLQLADDDLPDTEDTPAICFLHSLDIARRQGGRAWELRTAVSLSRLWQAEGKTGEAHALLASLYDSFGEGFDTLDLQAARAQLDALKAVS